MDQKLSSILITNKEPKMLTVKSWTSWDRACELPDCHFIETGAIKDLNEKVKWEDYCAGFDAESLPYLNALNEAIRDKSLTITGVDHQTSNKGIPVFSDDTVLCLSMESWGRLMAAIWNWSSDLKYSGRNFAYGRPAPECS